MNKFFALPREERKAELDKEVEITSITLMEITEENCIQTENTLVAENMRTSTDKDKVEEICTSHTTRREEIKMMKISTNSIL